MATAATEIVRMEGALRKMLRALGVCAMRAADPVATRMLVERARGLADDLSVAMFDFDDDNGVVGDVCRSATGLMADLETIERLLEPPTLH